MGMDSNVAIGELREWSTTLQSIRDRILIATPRVGDETLDESFHPGKIKLKDGSTVNLSESAAKKLNLAFSKEKNKDAFMETIMKNKHEFKHIVEFAETLHEETIAEVGSSTLNESPVAEYVKKKLIGRKLKKACD